MSLDFEDTPQRGRFKGPESFDYEKQFRATIASQESFKESSHLYIDALRDKDSDVGRILLDEAEKTLQDREATPVMKFFAILIVRDAILRSGNQFFIISVHSHSILEIFEQHAVFDKANKAEDRGTAFFGDKAPRAVGRSYLKLLLELIRYLAVAYPARPTKSTSQSRFAKLYERLLAQGVTFPTTEKFLPRAKAQNQKALSISPLSHSFAVVDPKQGTKNQFGAVSTLLPPTHARKTSDSLSSSWLPPKGAMGGGGKLREKLDEVAREMQREEETIAELTARLQEKESIEAKLSDRIRFLEDENARLSKLTRQHDFAMHQTQRNNSKINQSLEANVVNVFDELNQTKLRESETSFQLSRAEEELMRTTEANRYLTEENAALRQSLDQIRASINSTSLSTETGERPLSKSNLGHSMHLRVQPTNTSSVVLKRPSGFLTHRVFTPHYLQRELTSGGQEDSGIKSEIFLEYLFARRRHAPRLDHPRLALNGELLFESGLFASDIYDDSAKSLLHFKYASAHDVASLHKDGQIEVSSTTALFEDDKSHELFLKIIIYVLNRSDTDLTDLRLSFTGGEGSRMWIKTIEDPANLAPQAHFTKEAVVAVDHVPNALIELLLSCDIGGVSRHITCELPMTINKFMAFEQTTADDYAEHWSRQTHSASCAPFRFNPRIMKTPTAFRTLFSHLVSLRSQDEGDELDLGGIFKLLGASRHISLHIRKNTVQAEVGCSEKECEVCPFIVQTLMYILQ